MEGAAVLAISGISVEAQRSLIATRKQCKRKRRSSSQLK